MRALILNDVRPGVSNDEGGGDEWPQILERVRRAEILVLATPTWLGQPGSVSKRVVERMDALLSETDAAGRPFAYNRVAGVLVTGRTSSPWRGRSRATVGR